MLAESTDTKPASAFLNVGVYLPSVAGALAGVSGRKVGQWARRGFIQPSVFHGRPSNLYSYLDVAEAIVVHRLLLAGIPHADIRWAIDDARAESPEWPLLGTWLGVARLSDDDSARLVRRGGPDSYIDVSRVGRRNPGQFILPPPLLEEVGVILSRGGWIAHQRGLAHIEVAPSKLGGMPSLLGRRWTIGQVARIAADDEGREVLVESYGLKPVEIDESVTWMAEARRITRQEDDSAIR